MESSTGNDNETQRKKKPQRQDGNERRDRSKSHRPKGKQPAKTNKEKQQPAAPAAEPAPTEPDAPQKEGDDDTSSVDSGELCFICTEPIVTYAVGACDHRFCHLCALRLRALYKTRNCAYCKTEQPIVIFTKDAEKPFDRYTQNDTPFSDKKLGLRFEDKQSYQDTMLLLQFNCPDPSCDVACDGWSELKRHVKKTHDRYLCDLCTKHKKIFTHEHTLYTWHQLHKHYKSGDKALSDETGFKGHPECHFCNISFYGTDELYEHCRDKHEQCHICVRHGIRHEYYANYDSLEEHFKNDHYLCMYRECLDRKFVVFESDIDLKAHEVEEHGAPISRLQRSKQAEARRVDVHFDYGRGERNARRNKPRAEEPASSRRGGGEGASSSSSAAAAAAASGGTLSSSRAQSILSEENFPAVGAAAAQSSSASTKKAQQKQPQQQQTGIRKPPGFGALSADNWPTLGASSASSSSNSNNAPSAAKASAATVDAQTISKHAAFLERVFDMLKSHEKVAQYRSLTKAYRENAIDVDTYVNEVSDLCNNNIEHLRKIFRGTEELMDIQEKKSEIVRAWRNKQTALTNFPALEAPSDKPAGHGTSSRVLVIKSKNTKAGGTRTTGKSKAGVWDRVASAASGASGGSPRSSPQPSRPSSPALFPPPALINGQRTAWSGAAARSQATSEENFPALKPVEHFPSLPSAPKPASRIHFRRGNNVDTVNVWSSGSSAAASNTEPPVEEAVSEIGKKKKGKKNKQVLMRVGL